MTRMGGGAMDLFGQIVEANVRSLAYTTDAVIAGKDAELESLGRAFADLYDALDRIPDHSRSVTVDRLLRYHGGTRDRVEQWYLNPPAG